MAAGDILHWQLQHRRKNTNIFITTTTDDTTDIITVKSANHQIYVQKVVMTVTTYSAVTWTLLDDGSTTRTIAILSIPAAQATVFGDEGTVVWDFGPTGVPLQTGANLDFLVSATGAAGIVHIEAYEVNANVVAAASTN